MAKITPSKRRLCTENLKKQGPIKDSSKSIGYFFDVHELVFYEMLYFQILSFIKFYVGFGHLANLIKRPVRSVPYILKIGMVFTLLLKANLSFFTTNFMRELWGHRHKLCQAKKRLTKYPTTRNKENAELKKSYQRLIRASRDGHLKTFCSNIQGADLYY